MDYEAKWAAVFCNYLLIYTPRSETQAPLDSAVPEQHFLITDILYTMVRNGKGKKKMSVLTIPVGKSMSSNLYISTHKSENLKLGFTSEQLRKTWKLTLQQLPLKLRKRIPLLQSDPKPIIEGLMATYPKSDYMKTAPIPGNEPVWITESKRYLDGRKEHKKLVRVSITSMATF